MGGRGAASPGGTGMKIGLGATAEPLPYNVIGFDDEMGGAIYPFLEQSGRAWYLVTRPAAGFAQGGLRLVQTDQPPHAPPPGQRLL